MIGLLVAALGIAGLVSMVRVALVNRRTIREGVVAEAPCLGAYVVHNRSSDGYTTSQWRLILGFLTPEGRDVRAELVAHVPYAVGDTVPVRYLPECPERVRSRLGVGPRRQQRPIRVSASSSTMCPRRCVPESRPPRHARRVGHREHRATWPFRHGRAPCAAAPSSRPSRRARRSGRGAPGRTTCPSSCATGQCPARRRAVTSSARSLSCAV
ncbi:hypothetical protein [Streptomyces sp. fd1-xmd]|uniref:hypothetical protein n=1 Tax=Streptomyces sp. fd1-xmd TaxID=1812480 RepID=UPI0039A2AD64